MSKYFEGRFFREHIICKSGLKLSIQASDRHYSIPRENNAFSYSHCEIAVINKKRIKAFNKCQGFKPYYCEGIEGYVYERIEANTILKVIMKNGGILEGELPPLKFDRKRG
jgi:hypothetical protein